jgi:hypothetical protein
MPTAVPGTVVQVGSTVGPGGDTGVAGTQGLPAYSFTTGSITIPAIGSTVAAPLQSVTWANVGDMVSIQGGGGSGQSGNLQVQSIAGNTLTLLNPASVSTVPAPGTVVASGSLVSPSGKPGPTAVSADSGNLAQLGSDSLISVPSSSIWSVRLRSFNAIGNPTFEVDQANIHAGLTNSVSGTRIADRWLIGRGAGVTGTINTQCFNTALIKVPGTNFIISRSQLGLNTVTTQATLVANDNVRIDQNLEGPQIRELYGDVSSISILVYSSTVAPFTFAVALRDPSVAHSIVYLLTIPTAAIWTLLTIPNIPAFSGVSGGTFNLLPGNIGYILTVCIACGPTLQAPSTGSWLSGNYIGAAGMTNGLAAANTFYLGFVQHEPGAQASTLIDKAFDQNLSECQRYFTKSYPYGSKPGDSSLGYVCPFLIVPSSPASVSSAVGHLPFPKRMAKQPTFISYATNGTINSSTTYSAGTVVGVAGVSGNDSGLTSLNYSAAQTGGMAMAFHYTADTGW